MMDFPNHISPMISHFRRFYNERNPDRAGQSPGRHHPAGHAAGHRSHAGLGCDCTQKVLPRTPAVLVYGILGKGLNRIYRGQNIYGTILCYGWKNNSLVPMSKDLQAEMLDRLKEMEVRV